MIPTALAAVLLPGLLALAAGCLRKGPQGPSREELTSLLQQEAQALKATGEKLDPVLRVSATWTVTELTVSPQPNDPDRPFAGLIRFHIRAVTKDTGGSSQVDEFDRRFEYLWSAALHRWLIKPTP
jgi:hypothetical protein